MTAVVLDLFDEPDWLRNPGSKLERRFAEFHRACPEVYRELERRCLALRLAGRTRIGLKAAWEAMRFDRLLSTAPDLRLNNSFTALYARLLLFHHPELGDVIETRRRKTGAAA